MMPASLTTLVSGLAMVALLDGRPPFWVVWGLAGVCLGSPAALGAAAGARLLAATLWSARPRRSRRDRAAKRAGPRGALLPEWVEPPGARASPARPAPRGS